MVEQDSKTLNNKLKTAWKENATKEEEKKARVLKKFGKIKTVSSIIVSLCKLGSGGNIPQILYNSIAQSRKRIIESRKNDIMLVAKKVEKKVPTLFETQEKKRAYLLSKN